MKKTIIYLSIILLLVSFFLGRALPVSNNLSNFQSDTTIHTDINPDKKMEIITVTFPGFRNEGIYDYILTIDNDTMKGLFEIMDDAMVQLIDMDQSDGFQEVVIIAFGPSDIKEYKIFRHQGGKIINVGDINGYFGISTKGDGLIEADDWMGFWMRTQLYKLDKEFLKLLPIPEDVYSLKVDATVKKPFEILSERIDGATIEKILSPGTKITLIGADILPKCINRFGYVDDINCDWYLIRTEDGIEGWARLETFRDLVEGLVWAG